MVVPFKFNHQQLYLGDFQVAHIKHMNHSRDFHALWTKLRSEVLELQRKGYYGDGSSISFTVFQVKLIYVGYWSSGQRLSDSTRVVGEGFESAELPEYLVNALLMNQTTRRSSLKVWRRASKIETKDFQTKAQCC